MVGGRELHVTITRFECGINKRVERFLHGDYERVSETHTHILNKNAETRNCRTFRAENSFLFPVHITNRHKRPRMPYSLQTPEVELMVKVICADGRENRKSDNDTDDDHDDDVRLKRDRERENERERKEQRK